MGMTGIPWDSRENGSDSELNGNKGMETGMKIW